MQSRSPEAQNISAAKPLFQRVERKAPWEPRSFTEDNAFHRCARKSGYNCVTKCWQNSPRQLCGSALGKLARVAIRDSKFGICKSLAGQHFMLHNFNPLNEILYCFSRKSVPWPNLDTLAYKRFGTNAGADTQAPSERAARKI
jgi:hypothetical protein